MVKVEFKNVQKRFDDGFIAVNSLDLEVNDGEFLVLLGPSGCGKSTTLRMLAGLEEVTEGEIHIDGMKVNHLPPGARDLGMVFQSYALYPHMSIGDNLAFGLRMAKGEKRLPDEEITTRVIEIAELLELSDHLNKKPKELSGGQRQRVALGRALMIKPSVLMLDEPTAGVSPIVMDELFDHILKVKETNVAILMVEQNAKQALNISDRGYVLVTGKNKFSGSGKELLNDPEVRRSFLGG